MIVFYSKGTVPMDLGPEEPSPWSFWLRLTLPVVGDRMNQQSGGESMRSKRISEVLRFAAAGAAGFAVELLVLILLKEKLGIDTLIATPIAFLLSVIVNYVICVFWVFDGAREQSRKSQAGFLLTSVIGLLLNELLMFLFRVMWGEETVLFTVFSFIVSLYVLNKVIATILVMIWNYFTKRKILTMGNAGHKK